MAYEPIVSPADMVVQEALPFLRVGGSAGTWRSPRLWGRSPQQGLGVVTSAFGAPVGPAAIALGVRAGGTGAGVEPDLDVSFATATDLGELSTTAVSTLSGSIGPDDPADFYKFVAASGTADWTYDLSFNVTSGSPAYDDALLWIYDSSQQPVRSCYLYDGMGNQYITPGSLYYLKVERADPSATINYQIGLTCTGGGGGGGGGGVTVTPGTSFATAGAIGNVTQATTLASQAMGPGINDHYYSFNSVGDWYQFVAPTTDTSGYGGEDVAMFVYDSTQTEVGFLYPASSLANISVPAGTAYVRLSRFGGSFTYSLTITPPGGGGGGY